MEQIGRSKARKRDWVPLVILIFYSPAVFAADINFQCVNSAAARFKHDPMLLRALIEVESSGKCPNKHPKNANDSYDIGCMGINSSWLPLLQKKFNISEQDLYVPCTNIHIGAWILAKNIRTYGDHWRAVGAYNATTEIKRVRYAWKVNAKLAQLQ